GTELLQLYRQLTTRRLAAVSIGVRRGIEEVAGVKGIASAKSVSPAVKVVGPRADSHVDGRTGLAAVLCLGIFLQVELLDGVDGQDGGPIGERARCASHGTGVKGMRIQNAVDHPTGFIR